MSWLRLTVEADLADEEAIADILAALSGSGVEILDTRATLLVPEAGDLRPGRILLRVYIDTDESGPVSAGDVDLSEFPTATIGDPEPVSDDWQTRWKDFFHVTRVSERFIVRPPWESLEEPPDPQTIELVIEPGMAFGTGTHETTRLCLRALDSLVEPGTHTLDVGCGSGILSIAAAQLGARPIVALDIDQPAVDATLANAKVNRVEGRIDVSMTDLQDVPGTFDLVIANILSSILVQIKEGLKAHVSPGGSLLLSGILVEDGDSVLAEFLDADFQGADFQDADFFEVSRITESAWVCLLLRRA
ncbi:MAG: ribosomal protein L11 methyltransferase [Myxococcota bacterium]|jgi:ribosomal protein L11 methyltransferase